MMNLAANMKYVPSPAENVQREKIGSGQQKHSADGKKDKSFQELLSGAVKDAAGSIPGQDETQEKAVDSTAAAVLAGAVVPPMELINSMLNVTEAIPMTPSAIPIETVQTIEQGVPVTGMEASQNGAASQTAAFAQPAALSQEMAAKQPAPAGPEGGQLTQSQGQQPVQQTVPRGEAAPEAVPVMTQKADTSPAQSEAVTPELPAEKSQEALKTEGTKGPQIKTEEGADGETPIQQPITEKLPFASEKLAVKVSDGKTIEQPAAFTSDLGEKILYQSSQGKQEFDIQLSPAELGKITVKLIFESGKATVLYHCSNPQTQQALAANAEQLRHIIESGTGRPTEVVQGREPGGQMAQNHSQPDQHHENQARDEQQQRLVKEYALPNQNDVTAFLERFRLGLAQKGASI